MDVADVPAAAHGSLAAVEVTSEWGGTLLDPATALPPPPAARAALPGSDSAAAFRHVFELEVSVDEGVARSTISVRLLGPFTAKCAPA